MANTDKEWEAMIAEIMSKEIEDMTYDDLVKLTLAFKDNEEMNSWWEKGAGFFTKMQAVYKEKYGIAYPLRDDAPPKVVEAYKRLSQLERKAAQTGVIPY